MKENNGNRQIIWTLTKSCSFNCRQCAVVATPKGAHPSVKQCIKIANNIKTLPAEFDLSGGDIMDNDNKFEILKTVAKILGPLKCSASITGLNLDKPRIDFLKTLKNVDLTLNCILKKRIIITRQLEYIKSSVKAISQLSANNIPVAVHTVLNHSTATVKNLSEIQSYLDNNDIVDWVWLPLYPVGRASNLPPAAFEYQDLNTLIKQLPGKVKPKLQHTLKQENICHAKTKTLYISVDGKLVACPWALDKTGNPYKKFVLGDLLRESADKILSRNWVSPGCPRNMKII